VAKLVPYADRLQQIDDDRRSIKSPNKNDQLDMAELKLAQTAISNYGLHRLWPTENAS